MTILEIATVFHILGTAIGVGGTIASDVLFIRFLRSGTLSHSENAVMRTLSHLVVGGLIMLILSGIATFLLNVEKYLYSGEFWAKMTVVVILLINGVFLHHLVFPKLKHIFSRRESAHGPTAHFWRKCAFTLGPISMASWMTALFIGAYKGSSLSYSQGMGVWLVLMAVGIIIGQLQAQRYYRIYHSEN